MVTLSFDNGPEPSVTPHVLDTLARHSLKASFFVLGRKLATPAARALAQRAAAEGHWIGNHTFTHTRPLGELDRAAALAEFDRTEDALGWLHQQPRLFRPYGRQGKLGPHLLHPAVVDRLVSGRFTTVLWNTLTGDWRGPDGWVESGLQQCTPDKWNLVALHDKPNGAMQHLDRFLTSLQEAGIPIVQEFPADCVPIRDGQIVQPLERFTSSHTD